MTTPKTLRPEIVDLFRRRGLNPDVPAPAPAHDDDPYSKAEQVRLAMDYADKHIPARYIDAVADDVAVVGWVQRVMDCAVAASAMKVTCWVQSGPSLLVLGPTGVGKTYQAFGALRLLAGTGIRAKWQAVTAADLYARLRPRHGVDSEAEFRAIADADLLLVDDLGAAKTSEWVEEVNYRLVNWRYERILPTLFTSNVPPKQLSEALGERVASRLIEMTDRVVLQGADRRRISA